MQKIINDIQFKIKEQHITNENIVYEIILTIPDTYGFISDVYFIIRNLDNNILYPLTFDKNKEGLVTFKNNITLANSALYNCFFSFKGNSEIYNITNSQVSKNFDLSDCLKLSVNFEVPEWAMGKMMYHIFVDRFFKGRDIKLKQMLRRIIHKSWNDEVKLSDEFDGIWNNDFFGGDLIGIINKLDYIESLGVEILYLSPIMYSQSTHRYDTSDYELVDPYVGDNNDLKMLCEEAHKRGMKVILDAVFNHTGNDSKYYNEYNSFKTIGAYQNINSPYLDFYDYNIENNKPIFKYWWGMMNLPVCNCKSTAWQNYITGYNGIIDQWFALGIDGVRLDVADELNDEFINLIREAVKRNKQDGLIIGEVWNNPMRQFKENKKREYLGPKGMDTVMNYNFINSLIKYFRDGNFQELDYKIKEILYEYPNDTICSLMNFTSTHDMTRGINLFDKDIFQDNSEWSWNLLDENHEKFRLYSYKDKLIKAKEIYMAYIYALTFFPGILSIFYADEVGLEGIGNLNNRKPFPWDNIDYELLNFFKEIGKIRKKEKFLEKASLIMKYIDENIISFERVKDNEKMFIAVNRSELSKEIDIPEEYKNSNKVYSLKKSTIKMISPYGGIAIKK